MPKSYKYFLKKRTLEGTFASERCKGAEKAVVRGNGRPTVFLESPFSSLPLNLCSSNS